MQRAFSRFFSTVRRMEAKVKQPQWQAPAAQERPKLVVNNSLKKDAKVEFNPMHPNRITWYSCGPTVYDASHMGHARNYVSTDINRRLLQDYFGYDVFFVQNVTDIDDKIIIRARQGYLWETEKSKYEGKAVSDELLKEVKQAVSLYTSNNLSNGEVEAPVGSLKEFEQFWDALPQEKKNDAKFKMHGGAVKQSLVAIESVPNISIEDFLSGNKTVLVFLWDRTRGHTVTDHNVFRELSSYWEHDYDKDMAALNVLPPSVTTRVSEYVPEIVSFVSKIINNGFAYQTDEGVYFDTAAFENSGHDYAKLQPWNKGSQELIAEGEGSLSKPHGSTVKRGKNDFALWKKSKDGEPSWPSPWGEGRPGWHIECSVMASEVLGEKIDIHSGGIDLCFPHHDNELAQSEAFHENEQWINYFLHTGHLHIAGSKMSKSLKNFITIKEALMKYSARQLRLAFALQRWDGQLDFQPELTEPKNIESTFTNYFNRVRAYHREQIEMLEKGEVVSKKAGPEELELYKELHKTQDAVHSAFCDNLSTHVALQHIAALVQQANTYIAKHAADYKLEPLLETARWITNILRILGFNMNKDYGWASETESGGSVEEVAGPFVNVLSKFRDTVRSSAIAKAPYAEFLDATDNVRNFGLLELGVSLDDRGADQPALIKFVDGQEQAELIKQRDEKEQRELAKAAKKAEGAKKAEEERQKKIEKANVNPVDMFKGRPEFAEFDAQGMPTVTKEGEPVSKSAKKKLEKEYNAQKKLYEQYQNGTL